MKRSHSGEEVRNFIMANVEEHPKSIARIVSQKYGISRQSTSRYLRSLERDGLLTAVGNTRSRKYAAKPISDEVFKVKVTPQLDDDVLWRHEIRPLLNTTKNNVVAICQYGFTEMLNNVVAHSESKKASIELKVFPHRIQLIVLDEGIGIFKKIARDLGLEDERHAVLELTKGKLTTDTEHHTGEGVFFTSRMFDKFSILSKPLLFSHLQGEEEDWLLQSDNVVDDGTMVTMHISTDSTRTLKEVFDRYASQGDDYGFTVTHVPVALMRYGQENLVSRSQAKRLLARLEPFREVFLDFRGVDFIGQAFADEIFRVYKNSHPSTKIVWVRANSDVERMIKRVAAGSNNENQLKLEPAE